ncbi:MAG: hypothetical protein ACKV2V_17420 [Blastocatellia bacterium]
MGLTGIRVSEGPGIRISLENQAFQLIQLRSDLVMRFPQCAGTALQNIGKIAQGIGQR